MNYSLNLTLKPNGFSLQPVTHANDAARNLQKCANLISLKINRLDAIALKILALGDIASQDNSAATLRLLRQASTKTLLSI